MSAIKKAIVLTTLLIGSVFVYDLGYNPVHNYFYPKREIVYNPSIPMADNHDPFLKLTMTWNKYKKNEYQSHCSGVVITPTLAVTAKHCVLNFNDDTQVYSFPNLVEVYASSDTSKVATVAKTVRYGGSQDVALLEGDFSTFNSAPVFSNQMSIANYMSFGEAPGSPVGNCGFPYGANEMSCFQLYPKYFELSTAVIRGYTAPGMSGSPVFDINTGELLGIVVAVTQNPDELIAVPTFKLFDQLGIKP